AADVMGEPPVVVHPELCLRDVAICLREAGVGAAIVSQDGRGEGVISERDVVNALADGADPDLIWAADVMTPDPVWAAPDDSLDHVLEVMLRAGIRHLPVQRDGELLGVLSIRDVVARGARAGADVTEPV